jgi:hypothetical protein
MVLIESEGYFLNIFGRAFVRGELLHGTSVNERAEVERGLKKTGLWSRFRKSK